MKYFTAKLLNELNSQDVKLATAAMETWDRQLEKYKQHLNVISANLTPNTNLLASELCFHDAQLISLNFTDKKNLSLILRQNNQLSVLTFELTQQKPSFLAPATTPAFASEGMLWLYEEIDHSKQNSVIRILFSNGDELTISFTDVSVESFEIHPKPSPAPVKAAAKKKSVRDTFSRDYSTPGSVLDHLTLARLYTRTLRSPLMSGQLIQVSVKAKKKKSSSKVNRQLKLGKT